MEKPLKMCLLLLIRIVSKSILLDIEAFFLLSYGEYFPPIH